MKIITLHCDYIRFQALKKALKNIDELKDKKEHEIKECLVVLTAVEKNDSENELKQMVEAVKKTAYEVKVENIVIYPYAHLSSNLSSPENAQKILNEAEKILGKDFKITKAPFGYYKSFELRCKGHPLSELSKSFVNQTTTIKNNNSEEIEDISKLLKDLSRAKLDTSKLKENDHRIIGQRLDLFSFNEAAPGSIFWHDNGMYIVNQLKNFIRQLLNKYNYQEISTPQILDSKLFKVSGHWTHYKDNMFLTLYEDRDFGIKPMNCPGAMLVYRTKTRSYKDLPLRFAEFGLDHRKELSGVLAGLFRLIQFTQDDAHVFCIKEQLADEVKHMLEMIKIIYKDTFNFDYSFDFSTRPEKFMGEIKDWNYAENVLEEILKNSKVKYKLNKGEGAFYGPKIDLHITDSLGRSWQCATIQLDMQMPKRFQLSYIGEDNKEHTPFVIHRAILGAIERFIGVLIEHLNGNLPLRFSPRQVRVINLTERNKKTCEKIIKQIKENIPELRIDYDFRNDTVQSKIRDAELLRINYIVVVGDNEEKNKTIAVRPRGEKPKFDVDLDSFIKKLKKDILN